jgi:hypothetical protein
MREQLVVSGWLATATGGEMGGQAVVLMLVELSDVKLRRGLAWPAGQLRPPRPHKKL